MTTEDLVARQIVKQIIEDLEIEVDGLGAHWLDIRNHPEAVFIELRRALWKRFGFTGSVLKH